VVPLLVKAKRGPCHQSCHCLALYCIHTQDRRQKLASTVLRMARLAQASVLSVVARRAPWYLLWSKLNGALATKAATALLCTARNHRTPGYSTSE